MFTRADRRDQIIFYLQCPTGPPVVRVNYRVPEAVERALKDFLADHLDLLCTAWEDLHGDLRRA